MKKTLIIAALALGISATSAAAQKAIDISDRTVSTNASVIDENVVQVHRKHKRYKRYSRKHFRKYHRHGGYYSKKKYRAKRYHRHYGHRHYRHFDSRNGPILYGGGGGIYIRIH